MGSLLQKYHRIERFIGNVKFAVFIILLFAAALAAGTFVESWHGADYANRLVYKSLWFMGIQFFMFLSILFATLIRLPFKKRLFGFYLIHSGLILIFLGSFITYVAGVDGTLMLMPNQASRTVSLNSDQLIIRGIEPGREIKVSLPFIARPTDLSIDYAGVKLGVYFPFAEKKVEWLPVSGTLANSTHYRIFTESFGENFLLSLHPDSSFPSTLQLGPLNLHYLPSSLLRCFAAKSEHDLFIWNAETQECEVPQRGRVKLRQIAGKLLADISFPQGSMKFFPQLSPLPLDQALQMNQSSPLRIFSRALFERGSHLFLFGENGAFFDKKTKHWTQLSFDKAKTAKLPWMGMKLKVLQHQQKSYPVEVPRYLAPVQENGKMIVGELKTIEVEVGKKKFWVTSDAPISFRDEERELVFEFSKSTVTLPYEITLDNFKMQHDPGTKNPASYESFVTLFRGNVGSSRHHVYMNHPLKVDDFTFYQSSYFNAGKELMGSVFSVNRDPGRPWKYAGSFLLVFGSAWHYLFLAFQRRRQMVR